MMGMMNTLGLSVALLSMAACASTGGATAPEPEAYQKAVMPAGDIFSPLEGGGFVHNASKAQCPTFVGDYVFQETTLFNPDGSDVACQYLDGASKRYATVYFYQWDKAFTPLELAQTAGSEIVGRFPEAKYLEDESRSCSLSIDLISGLNASMFDGKNEIHIGQTPCFIFQIDAGTTLVAVDVVNNWNLKLRLSSTVAEDKADSLAEAASTFMALEKGWISGQPNALAGILQDKETGDKDDDAI